MGEIVTLLGQVAETTSECAWLSPIADAAARNWFWTMVAGVFVVLLTRTAFEIAGPPVMGRILDTLGEYEGVGGGLPDVLVTLLWLLAAVFVEYPETMDETRDRIPGKHRDRRSSGWIREVSVTEI